MKHEAVLSIQLQRPDTDGDCCVAALATVTGRSYEDILAEASKDCKEPHNHGMHFTDIERVAARIGWVFRRKRKPNFISDIGILSVIKNAHRKKKDHHAIVLAGGLVFDLSDGKVWLPEVFKQKNHALFGCILIPK